MYLEEKKMEHQVLEAQQCLEMLLTLSVIEEMKTQTIVGCGQEKGGGTCNFCSNEDSD